MRTTRIQILLLILLLVAAGPMAAGQPKTWTLDDCIDYALSQNIDVRKSDLSTQTNELSLEQSKANLLPSLEGSVSHDFSWSKAYDSESGHYGSLDGSNSSSYSLSSGISLFKGFKLKNSIRQARLNVESSKYYAESVKESVELNILDAYLQILYAEESVNNAREQIASTTEQLAFAEERLKVGVISKADYLQIKSELASEKHTMANEQSTLSIARLNLMQLMELPVDDAFSVFFPDLTHLLEIKGELIAEDIYRQALQYKPEIKQAALSLESVKLDEKLARADLIPQLSLSTGLSTGWSSEINGAGYTKQLNNSIKPFAGITLSIPIFNNKQAQITLKQARISTSDAELDEIDVKNGLRKEIEQACVDLETAKARYEASQGQYEAATESYQVAEEKYELGLINSVDFLSVKTDLITSESELVQAKYNFIFSNKVVDFYKGIPISLEN
ncbi:MAG: TolC family protein [Mangrovibacterium sp.]